MAQVGFYHLTRTNALVAIPKLLGRTLAAGQRAMVVCRDGTSMQALSAALWASENPAWLPHGCAGEPGVQPARQPIWVTDAPTAEPPNGAAFLFLVQGAEHLPGFARIFDVFDGQSEAEVVRARARWSSAKAAGHQLTYWQQGEAGWAAKATSG